MRPMGLLAVVLFVFLPVYAAAADPSQTAADSAQNSSSTEMLPPGMISIDKLHLPADMRLNPGKHLVIHGPMEVTCLKMRTYIVARDEPDSDVTHPVAYRTCIPSSKYDFKSADVTSVDVAK